jgi:excisionase family DNA binding protein
VGDQTLSGQVLGEDILSALRAEIDRLRQVERQPEDHDEQILLTPERAAKRLDLSRRTIYELMNSGELPSVRVGRARRLTNEGLREYVRRRLVAA